MFLQFFTSLRDAQVPVTLREYLTLMEALDADLADYSVENFYYLSRTSLVKDERNLDKFDRVFGTVFKGLESLLDAMEKAEIPEEWLKKLAEKYLSEEEKKQIEAMGWDKLMETLKKRLEEQKGRHQGGSKWIGTAGTSPFGAHGYNPEGVRIGQDKNRNNRAVKVWDKREFRDLDGNVELGIRNIKVALRRLRKFARTGAPDELDLDTTIRETANHGYLDVHMRPERRNAVKLLVFFDIGGISSRSRSCSRRRRASSSTWSISTSTTASMKACGSRTSAASPTAPRPGTCCTNIRTTTRSCSSATPR